MSVRNQMNLVRGACINIYSALSFAARPGAIQWHVSHLPRRLTCEGAKFLALSSARDAMGFWTRRVSTGSGSPSKLQWVCGPGVSPKPQKNQTS